MLPVHSVLNPCDSADVPFEWTINPYRGCSFACRYCYARYTHEWLDLDPADGFDRIVLLKRDFADVLERDLARLRHRGRVGERIAIGTATDPYQPAEHHYGLTRSALEVFAREERHRLSITTKSDIVVRDIPLLKRIMEANHLRVHVTITTTDRKLARLLEPGAPSPEARLSTMATLARAGVAVDAFVMPVLPGLTDSEEQLDELFGSLAEAGVKSVICNSLFLRSPTREIFFDFLRRELPEHEEFYRNRYQESVHAPPLTIERLRARVRRLREKHGLLGVRPTQESGLSHVGLHRVSQRRRDRSEARVQPTQLSRHERSAGPSRAIERAPAIRDRRAPNQPRNAPPRSGPEQLRLF